MDTTKLDFHNVTCASCGKSNRTDRAAFEKGLQAASEPKLAKREETRKNTRQSAKQNAPKKATKLGIRAVFFDLGGVIVRTEYQAPREYLAERLGLEYEDLVRLVFESETSRKAPVGAISEDEHWAAVMRRLKRPAYEAKAVREEFFAGDIVDRALIEFIRSLRPRVKTGVISNAWNGLRAYTVEHKFDDAFDRLVISAEVGVTKPKAEIYLIALEQLGVSPTEALFVDDFIENVEGARAVGMSAIQFKEPEQAIQQVKTFLKH